MSKKNSKAKQEAQQAEDSGLDQAQAVNESETAAKDESESAAPTAEDLLALEKDKFLRLFAEFENYKKRTTKERIDLFKTAGREVISSMLPVIDDFERALAELQKQEQTEHAEGILLIYNKLVETLKAKGLTVLEVAAGDAFTFFSTPSAISSRVRVIWMRKLVPFTRFPVEEPKPEKPPKPPPKALPKISPN